VQAWCRENGRGLPVRGTIVPITPSAILFDLLNGGDKEWGRYPPYRELGYEAAARAASEAGLSPALGSVGGGLGATTFDLKGGTGSASALTSTGHTIAALALVNSIGSAVMAGGPFFWAAPFEEGAEFGGRGLPARITPEMRRVAWKGGPDPATTIALVATDAILTKAEAKRLAIVAQGGLAKALRLSFASRDGDTVFAASTGYRPLGTADDFIELGAVAADCLARAIARGVYEATALPFPGALPAWRDLFGR
jgi:L-aminopeptidase/D-esterase-like protein